MPKWVTVCSQSGLLFCGSCRHISKWGLKSMVLEKMTNVGNSWFSYRKITQQLVCDFKILSRNGDEILYKIPDRRFNGSFANFKLNLRNHWLDWQTGSLLMYSWFMEVNPALLPVFLPLCERHNPVGLRCQHVAYVFQQLGRGECTQTERRIHMWGRRVG